MTQKVNDENCCEQTDASSCGCRVEALVSIDERGHMVLPKGIRDKMKIGAGDKLAVTSWEKNGKVYCISLIKAEEFTEMVKGILGPVMQDILKE